MRCERCAGERWVNAGRDRGGRQLGRCAGCSRRQTERSGSAFSQYRFPGIDHYLSDRREAGSARAFCERALSAAEGQPTCVTSDKASAIRRSCASLCLRPVQDDGHGGRFCRGHALIRNLARGSSTFGL